MSKPLNVALVGHGYAGRVFHAPLIQATDGLRLHSIVSGNPETARQRPGIRVVAEPQQVIDDSDIDALVIATPNHSHAPLARQGLLAGKHVLVDKPFATSSTEARLIADVARSVGKVVSVFQNRRWDADFLTVKRLLEDNTLGRISEFHSHMDRFRPQVRDRWRESDVPGAGLWFDLGPHLLDQAVQLFGAPLAIQADIDRQRDGARGDDYFDVTLHYSRRRVRLHAGTLVADPVLRFAVHGDRGSYVKRGLDPQETFLLQGQTPGGDGWGVDTRHGHLTRIGAGNLPETVSVTTVSGDYRICYERWRDAILGGSEPPVTMAEAIELMGLLELAVASADSGQRLVTGS